MQASEGKIGRVFMLRLEDGDKVPGCIESYARENNVTTGYVLFMGGLCKGDVVVGPRSSTETPPHPMTLPIDGAHEVAAIGILAPDEAGNPVLHIHGSMGRSGVTLTGCLRKGVDVWLTGEAVLYEVVGTNAVRLKDEKSGFNLLTLGERAAISPEAQAEAAKEEHETTGVTPDPVSIPAEEKPACRIIYRFNAEVN